MSRPASTAATADHAPAEDPEYDHLTLFLPGPTEVRSEVLEAQTRWMVGHRMEECAQLIGSVEPMLQDVFRTHRPVLISASSGTGLWEGASRNCIRRRVLHAVNGAFSERWAEVSAANGKEVEILDVPWGEPVLPEQVADRLASGGFDAVAVVHNETSTGVLNPLEDIARAVRDAPGGSELMLLVDAVSSLSGIELLFDEWDLDVVLTSSQKAFALPPGLAFCAVSEKAMARAAEIENRGYYFDFITLERYLRKNQTPATPAISLLYALEVQLRAMLDEGVEKRWARHASMRDIALAWAQGRGMSSFARSGYESPTVTCVNNSAGIDVPELNRRLRARNMILSGGYGRLKSETFRIGHMGDHTPATVRSLLLAVDEELEAMGA